jgi:lysophospholipid acyltransferase (LPLAT)-like uncharacterized protein
MKEKLLLYLVPRVASILMRALHGSARVRHLGLSNIVALNESGRTYMIAFWHCYILLMVFCRHRKPITVMISRHRDGEYIASTMERFGVAASRGSSSRGGGEALRQMVELSDKGWNIAITPDGPRGPARVAQPGVVVAASRSGVPIIPIAVISDRKTRLRSWDGFEVPHPFSRVMFVYGEPITIPPLSLDDEIETWRLKVETAMCRMSEEAEQRFDELWRSADR